MIEVVGWVCTGLVLAGYYLNAAQKRLAAMASWIVGDIGWVVYDIYINNLSHAVLSGAIISLNLYGIYKIIKTWKKTNY